MSPAETSSTKRNDCGPPNGHAQRPGSEQREPPVRCRVVLGSVESGLALPLLSVTGYLISARRAG